MTSILVRGIRVNFQVWNEEGHETIVLLHGFTGSIKTWAQLSKQLPSSIRIIAIDLLGHGKTDAPANASRYSMTEQIEDLECLFQQLKLQQFTLLGYSMGGRVALSYAVSYPDRIKHLILESASPGLDSKEEQEARRKADELLANKIEQFGIENFVNQWENIPLFSSQKKLPLEVQQAIREERLGQTEIGLANSLRGMGTGAQTSLWNELERISFPVYLITGELDQKFCRIAKLMKERIPKAEQIIVSNVGHAIHVENSTQFATIVKKVFSK